MRIIDISLPIDDSLKETHSASIDRISHADGVEHFNWVLMKKKFEDNFFFFIEKEKTSIILI